MKKVVQFFKNLPAKRVDAVLLASALSIFSSVVLVNISTWSIWFDEAFSWYVTQFDFAEIAHYTALDVHPPMYYWALKLWEGVFGTSEFGMRSMSLFFATIAIIFGYLFVRRQFGRRAANVTLIFLALSPMLVRYSQEARMYTMAAAITMAGTYVLALFVDQKDALKRRRLGAIYAILVSLGVWTNYFTALVWIAHWVWRAIVVAQEHQTFLAWRKAFFTKTWLIIHAVAIALFVPWLPFMAKQLFGIQAGGFWIGAVTVDTFTSYTTTVLYYLANWRVKGLLAAICILIVVALIVLAVKYYLASGKEKRLSYTLVLLVALLPVVLLFVASLPPLKSSFVERYLLPASVGFSLLAGITLALGGKKLKLPIRAGLILLTAGAMIFGITQVYNFGNNNNNANYLPRNKQLMQQIADASPTGAPVIADSPYLYYELSYYATAKNPVYYLYDQSLLTTGSTVMLYDHPQNAIRDLKAFAAVHPATWIATQDNRGEIIPLKDEKWQAKQSVGSYDYINNQTRYKATEFLTANQ